MPLEVAVIRTVPTVEAAAVTKPCEPGELLMVAIVLSDESQMTDEVIFCLLLFEYVPVAVNSVVVPSAMLGSAGVTAIEVRVAGWPGGSPVSSPLVRHAVRRVMNTKISTTKPDSRFMIFTSSSGRI